MATFLLVPGAWLGGWCWRDVSASLRERGHTVVAATLTGLGERAHLLAPTIGLQTHVADVLALLQVEDLENVALVGHSYGGMVITAVAERAPERLARLVYVDASVPADGQSNNDVVGREMAGRLREAAQAGGEGWRVPPASYVTERLAEPLQSWVRERLTPHPLRSFEEAIRLQSKEAVRLPKAFVQTSMQSELYCRLMAQARGAGWSCHPLTGGHYAMFTAPQAVASVLSELAA